MRMTIVLLRLLLVWSCVYPLVLGISAVLNTLAPELPFSLRAAVLSGCLVPLISLVVAPLVGRLTARLVRTV